MGPSRPAAPQSVGQRSSMASDVLRHGPMWANRIPRLKFETARHLMKHSATSATYGIVRRRIALQNDKRFSELTSISRSNTQDSQFHSPREVLKTSTRGATAGSDICIFEKNVRKRHLCGTCFSFIQSRRSSTALKSFSAPLNLPSGVKHPQRMLCVVFTAPQKIVEGFAKNCGLCNTFNSFASFNRRRSLTHRVAAPSNGPADPMKSPPPEW